MYYAPNQVSAAQVLYRTASSYELHLRFTCMEFEFQNILMNIKVENDSFSQSAC